MKRIDLDDLPPKLAALLTSAEPGEEILLVQNGGVAGRLTAIEGPPPQVDESDDNLTPEERQAEVFEHFRLAMDDEF